MPDDLIQIPGGWFDPQGHIYRGSRMRRVLSVTQVFQILGLVNYDHVQREVLERKSEIGIAVHRAVELLGEDSLDWDTVDDAAIGYVVGAEQWLREMAFELDDSEQRGIHVVGGMQFGFQYDLRGKMLFCGRKRHVLIDLKTTVEESITWPLQTAAYALAAPKLPDGEAYLRVVLHLQPQGRAKALYYQDPTDETTFLYMLYVAIWKLNAGFELDAVRAA
jgi:hypothetical protein